MKIKITKDNIELGLRGSCTLDPVGRAMFDAGFQKPWASPVLLEDRATGQTWVTPVAVVDFMFAFDNRKFVEPMEFEL